jgi:Trk-type K+ transport system membrane component
MSFDSLWHIIWIVISASIGFVYFFSRRFRAKKKNEWRKESKFYAISEWGDWLLAIFAVLALALAAVLAYSGYLKMV